MSTIPTTIALLLASILLFTATAQADDEGSEHSAQLYGDDADTLGVYLEFDEKAGWGMSFRPKPGAALQQIPLPFLPADHAHYAVVVGPKRHWLAFITQSRPDIDLKAEAVWTMNAKGTVVDRWSFGELMTAEEQASLSRSISHTRWLEAAPILKGHRIELRLASHSIVVAPLSSELRRIR